MSPMGRTIERAAREPLLHFLVIGVVIFALAQRERGQGAGAPEETIVVSEGKIDQIVEIWSRTRMRPPTLDELRGLIEAHVKEEVLYREALAVGLDRDDTIVRRRLAQKMDFVAEGLAEVAEPSDDDLQTLLDSEPERFRTGGSTSFRQVFISLDDGPEAARARAAAALERLRAADPDPRAAAALGDPILLEPAYRDVTVDQLGRQFGAAFAADLESIEPGAWSGPVESAYGLHLVQVLDHQPPLVPPLDAIRSAVREEWLTRRRRETQDAFYRALRDKYEVVVDWPGGDDEDVAP
jgi:hypothetical protein